MNKHRLFPHMLVLLTAAATVTTAEQPLWAQDGELSCPLHQRLPIERQLRRASLALRGHIPSIDELDAVEGKTALPAELYDAFLNSDAYRVQMRRFHEQQLWTNPAGASLTDVGVEVRSQTIGGTATKVWTMANVGKKRSFRGGNGSHFCQDVPQTQLQPGYQLGDVPSCEVKGYDTVNGELSQWCQEGWVELKPYWLPAAAPVVKACAFAVQLDEIWQSQSEDLNNNSTLDVEDANQDGILQTGEDLNGNGFLDMDEDRNGNGIIDAGGQDYRCDYTQASGYNSGRGCGCGPALSYCNVSVFQFNLWSLMREQLLLTVDDHTSGAHPYSQLLTTKDVYYNGPLLHFKKYLAQQSGFGGTTYNAHHSGDAPLPAAVDWTDENWVKLQRQAPHSGILTLPAFTLRFQTNRGRANRFRIAFTDQHFVPPSVYDNEGCEPDAEDLTQKCVCRQCHETLEPLAAYFGQVSERGSGLLSDFGKSYTDFFACQQQLFGVTSGVCNRFYVADYSMAPVTYRLLPLQFAADHPEFEKNFDEGPAGITQLALAPVAGSGYSLFARATVKHLFAFLLNREMNLDPAAPDNEIALLEELATEFTSDDDFKALTLRLVQLDAFGRML